MLRDPKTPVRHRDRRWPAAHVDRLVVEAQDRGWDVQVISTPSGLAFIDVPKLEELTGSEVRSEYRKPGQPRSKPADAIILAPATYNTINKRARRQEGCGVDLVVDGVASAGS